MNIKKILKRTGIFILSILTFLTILIFSLRIPAVQNFIKDQFISYLEDKIKTKVQLEKVYISFPNKLTIKKLYLQGKDVDTLIYVDDLDVGLDIPKLIDSKANITSIDLNTLRTNIVRDKKGDFNFDYILKAFATKEEEQSESKPFVISLDKIKLQDIGVKFTDYYSGNHINAYFKEFNTRVQTFDLDKNTYRIDDIFLDGLRLKLKQDIVEEIAQNIEEKTDSLSKKVPLSIGLKNIILTNFDVDYNDQKSKTQALVKFKKLKTKIKELDLENNLYQVENILLSDADIKAQLNPTKKPDNKIVEKENTTKENNLNLLLQKLKLENVKLTYHNHSVAPLKKGIDFNHLKINDLNLDLRDFKIQDDTFSGKVLNSKIQENKGLDILAFKTDFLYSPKEAFLKNLYLETPKTILRNEASLRYNSVEELSQNIGNVDVNLNLLKSKIAFSDILLLAPNLRGTPPFNRYPNAILSVNARAKGKINDLHIPYLHTSGLDDLKINLSGRIKNATQPEKLFYNLNIQEFTASKKVIHKIAPANAIPKNINLPTHFKLKGIAKGNTKVIHTNLALQSTDGNANLLATIDLKNKNREIYDVTANIQNLNIGKIIGNKQVGHITAKLQAKGKSFDFNNATSQIKGKILSAKYNNYAYKNIDFNGKILHKKYDISLVSRDKNANLNLYANGVYHDKQPTIALNGSIQKLDVHQLGFYKEPLIIAGDINGNFTNISPDFLNGNLSLENISISDTKQLYSVQNIVIESQSTAENNRLSVQSPIIDAEITGKYRLTQISDILLNTINDYYTFQNKKSTKKFTPNQYFTFNAKIKNEDLLRKFVPELTDFETITLNGNFDADSRKLQLNGNIPSLTYAKNKLKNTTFSIENPNNVLQYQLHTEGFDNESIALHNVDISGNIAENTIQYQVSAKDAKNVEQFLVAGTAKSIGKITEISLNPNGLKLNYDSWAVAEQNKLQLSNSGIWADNFILSKNDSEISIDSETESPKSPLNVHIKNFKIENITEFMKKDSLLAKGTINGTAQIKDPTGNMAFTSNLEIRDLFILGNPVGNIYALAQNKTKTNYQAEITLSGYENDAKIIADLDTTNNLLDAKIYLNKLQMKTAEAFAMGNISKAEGYLSGLLTASGTMDTPSIIGDVRFNNVGVFIPKTGSSFKNINDEISFTRKGIHFEQFKVFDADNNSLNIHGDVLTQNYKQYQFDLEVNADNFKVVNSEQNNDALTYGILAVDTRLRVGGDLDLPTIDGKIAVTDQTDFTFVLPQSTPSLQERDGIIEFINKEQITLQQTIKTDSISSQSKIKGIDANVNIEIDRNAKTSILIDKVNGDFVKIQGEANLNGGIDPSGKTTLTGVFQIEEGAYEMSLSLLKRKFEIQKGSTITWTGEPTEATLNITAIYKTNAAPIDLLQQQLAGLGNAEMNMYKQQIPFNTHLKLKGELLKPEIKFDILLNDTNPSVPTSVIDNTKAKLEQLRNQESEMNKQVFALLLLNRFIGENPFESQAGVSTSTMAIQSVSGLLTQQLNNLAADLIQGVDINFGLDTTEDYSSGNKNTRTDLSVNISKKLLNDRLKVSIGSDFGLDGEARQNEKMTNIAGDINIDYMLSKDGRYMLRAYRKNQYQVALQGQIIETGVGFIITMDYNEFKNIFQKKLAK